MWLEIFMAFCLMVMISAFRLVSPAKSTDMRYKKSENDEGSNDYPPRIDQKIKDQGFNAELHNKKVRMPRWGGHKKIFFFRVFPYTVFLKWWENLKR